MSALEKQFRACVKFLNGVRSLPQYENVERKQLQGLVTAVGKVAPLSAAQASTLLEWVDAGNFKTDMAEHKNKIIREVRNRNSVRISLGKNIYLIVTIPSRVSKKNHFGFVRKLSEFVRICPRR